MINTDVRQLKTSETLMVTMHLLHISRLDQFIINYAERGAQNKLSEIPTVIFTKILS